MRRGALLREQLRHAVERRGDPLVRHAATCCSGHSTIRVRGPISLGPRARAAPVFRRARIVGSRRARDAVFTPAGKIGAPPAPGALRARSRAAP
jgi:hypothetical protein